MKLVITLEVDTNRLQFYDEHNNKLDKNSISMLTPSRLETNMYERNWNCDLILEAQKRNIKVLDVSIK